MISEAETNDEVVDAEYLIPVGRHFSRSQTIGKLAAALAKAQGEIEGATKDKVNPAFSTNGKTSKYADLASIWEAIRAPLSKNELAVLQFPREGNRGIEVETILVHSSGEFVSEILWMPVEKDNAHGVGSAITYGRRFSLAAIVGVAPEDDDGNAAAAAQPKASDKKWDSRPASDNARKETKPVMSKEDCEKAEKALRGATDKAQLDKFMKSIRERFSPDQIAFFEIVARDVEQHFETEAAGAGR